MSDWWNKGTDIPLEDKTFREIINFYLFNCPSEIRQRKGKKSHFNKVSNRGVTLSEKGWINGYVSTLTSCMKKGASNKLVYNRFNTSYNIAEETKNIEKTSTLADKHFEMITISEHSNMNIPNSIFYYIRNAFAHGSFSVITADNTKIYYLESSKNGVVKAQMRLRQETFLKWIKDFTLSPTELRKILRAERKQNNKKKRKAA